MNAVDLEIDHYLAGVRAALADLPDDVRDELLEDLPGHFAEILAERSGSLEQRLGSPILYAAELRAAAGLDAGSGSRRRIWARFDQEAAANRLRTFDAKVGFLIGYERATDFLRLLGPAWWVVRGYVAALLLYEIEAAPGHINEPLGWLLTAGLIVLSIRIGAITPRLPGWSRYAIVPATVLVVVIGFASLSTGTPPADPSVTYDRWSQVTDVFPYDSNGRPLSDITLYDQYGNPLLFGDYWRCVADNDMPRPRYPLCRGPRAAPSTPGSPTPPAGPTSPPASPPPPASPAPSLAEPTVSPT
jgi:hypothetical protein